MRDSDRRVDRRARALYRLLELLPPRLSVPVQVVQHIADGFVPGLASCLSGATSLPVTIAEHDHPLAGAQVHVAPDRFHLKVVRSGRALLSEDAPVSGFRLSASVPYALMAQVYAAGAVGVVLAGMGSEGLPGARCGMPGRPFSRRTPRRRSSSESRRRSPTKVWRRT